MNYEEKYKQALERARDLMTKQNPPAFNKDLISLIFPELVESDERVRQEIRNFIWEYPDKLPERDKWLAWLEKQDEQKPALPKWKYRKDHTPLLRDSLILNKYGCVAKSPSGATVSNVWVLDYDELAKLPKEELEKQGEKKPDDNVEPKFKVGNWYQCIKDFFGKGVTFDKNTAYYCAKEGCLQNEYGCHIAIVKDLYDSFKLWTIADAKNGDVLVCNINKAEIGGDIEKLPNITSTICIYQNVVKDKDYIHSYCSLYEGSSLVLQNTIYYNMFVYNIHPATKEQRELLFAKMREAGYKWDSENKELKKIEQYYNGFHLRSLDELREQREKTIKELEAYWGQILALVLATPKDICPDADEPASYVSQMLAKLREEIDECNYRIQAYSDIEDGWETKEED